MVLDRQVFQYQNKNLVERVLIEPPFRYETIFQNEGCFIYIKGANTEVLSLEKKLSLKDREAVFLKCGTYFVDWLQQTDTSVEVIAIHLYPEILKQLYQNELPKVFKKNIAKVQAKKIIPDNTISKFIESLEFYFENPGLVNDDLLELKIKELILLLVQTKNATSVLELVENLYSPRTASLKKVVDLNLYENLSVEELAKLCGLSLSSFKREFSALYKDSPMRFINTRKIEKAKELLEMSNLPISEISYQVGFNDPHYFTRCFKKEEGIPPSAYRKLNES